MLTTSNLTIRFGGLTAVNKVSVHIAPGKITGLIGPNGAGKTTFFNAISGVYTPDEGEVVFQGKRIEGLKPHKINHVGISRTYQVINLFWKMTVLENVLVGMHPVMKSNYFSDLLHLPGQRREAKACEDRAWELLRFVGLEGVAHHPAGSLSYGKQRLLEIVRALASQPKLVLLDEPAAGMNTSEKRELDDILQRILGAGYTVLMVEHDMQLVMDVCDYIYVLSDGKLLAHGAPEEVRNNPEVIKVYLGGE